MDLISFKCLPPMKNVRNPRHCIRNLLPYFFVKETTQYVTLLYLSPYFKMCHPPRENDYLTINHEIKIYDSSITYSGENESILIELVQLLAIYCSRYVSPTILFINKFNITLSFLNLKNVDIFYIFFD